MAREVLSSLNPMFNCHTRYDISLRLLRHAEVLSCLAPLPKCHTRYDNVAAHNGVKRAFSPRAAISTTQSGCVTIDLTRGTRVSMGDSIATMHCNACEHCFKPFGDSFRSFGDKEQMF